VKAVKRQVTEVWDAASYPLSIEPDESSGAKVLRPSSRRARREQVNGMNTRRILPPLLAFLFVGFPMDHLRGRRCARRQTPARGRAALVL